MKRAIVALLLISLAATAEAGGKWHTTVAAAQKEAKQKKQLIFVDLFADWCGWCHRMEKEVFPSETFQKATTNLVLLRLDTEDGAEGTRMAQQLGVHQLPTFLLITDDLSIAGIISGYAPPERFVAQMKNQEEKYKEFLKELANEPKAPLDKRLDLAAGLITRHSYAQAEQKLTKLRNEKLTPSMREQVAYNLAISQLGQKKHDLSIKTIDTALSRKPAPSNIEQLRFLKAQVYLDAGNLKSGLDELKKFRISYPNSQLTQTVNRLVPQIEQAIKTTKK